MGHKVDKPTFTGEDDEYPRYMSKPFTRCICGKGKGDHHHTAHFPPWRP